ncbi:hypothetical protein TIFTF001_041058 [Ficus carica]|uniref:Uncharacterized protein n=1 Tax=Ficus carica TaxID=3494 RepID=A0AA88CMT5_FICCA|nr:hypothetical protein TIFTF001_041058 [Ficus carica]
MNFEFEGTSISGIMGLIWSPDSLMTQVADFIQNRFSYCVVPYDKGWARPSLLTFGSVIPTTLGNVQTTRRTENVLRGLELCCEMPAGDFIRFATMTYHFDGAD